MSSSNVAYHGVTLGVLALTGVMPFKEPFGPPAITTRHVSNTNPFRSAHTAPGSTPPSVNGCCAGSCPRGYVTPA